MCPLPFLIIIYRNGDLVSEVTVLRLNVELSLVADMFFSTQDIEVEVIVLEIKDIAIMYFSTIIKKMRVNENPMNHNPIGLDLCVQIWLWHN